MSKITFRADDDLVDAVNEREESKSEVMREALRAYLDDVGEDAGGDSIDDVVAGRVDELVERRLVARARERDVNVNITVEPADGLRADVRSGQRAPRQEPGRDDGRTTDHGGRREQSCAQCGETLSDDHVYCPNCGEKATRRVFCECGDEVRADWSFCPHCGRRTASADALDR